jgi:hypothetical protein
MAITFSWNPGKALANLRKHGVTFDEAATAFDDPSAAIRPDPRHSFGEERWVLLGRSATGRTLAIMFTERDGDCIRLISARRATARERNAYEEGFR